MSFYAARRGDQIQPLQISVDGNAVGTPITPASANFALSTSASFTVSAGSHTLQFATTSSSGDNSSFIDAVVINPAMGPTGLSNGGFEAPVLGSGSYQYQPSGAGWTFSGGAGIQSNGSAWNAPAAPEGQQTAFLQEGQIAQTLTLAAGTYTVSFYAARRGDQIQPLQISVDGNAVGAPITPASANFALSTSASFTVSAGSHTLQFATTSSSGDNSSFIDAVTISGP